MTPFFDPAVLTSFFVLANAAACPTASAPAVELVFNNTPPVYSSEKSAEELGGMTMSTTFSRKPKEVFSVSGVTNGEIRTSFSMGYEAASLPGGDYCANINKLVVTLEYVPTVYISKGLQAGSCNFNVTVEHELRHVNTDIIAINEFRNYIRDYAQYALNQGVTFGPVPQSGIEAGAGEIKTRVESAINTATAELNKVRLQRQQMIDTRQEYLRLSKLCPSGQ